MPGGYVGGRRFYHENEYLEAIEDNKIVERLRKETDFKDPKAVETLYSRIQSGEYSFKTVIGRSFDDEIYELIQKNKSIAEAKEKTKADKKRGFSFLTSKSKRVSANTIKTSNLNNDIEAAAQEILQKKALRRKVIIVFASVVAAISLGYFVIYSRSAYLTMQAYEELASLKGSEPVAEEIEQKPLFTLAEDEAPPEILDEYKNLYIKNNSIVGWLTIDGTNIDYPVMQTIDNEYYLTHDFEGNNDRNGALFLDAGCNVAFRSTNLIVYGHHMKSGKMFGNLKKYESEDYCKKHNLIFFDTIYEKGTYEVMYVFKDNIKDEGDVSFKYYQFINAVSVEEYNSNLKYMSEISLYDTGVEAEYGDDLLTLSTCNGSGATDRFVVVAKRIE